MSHINLGACGVGCPSPGCSTFYSCLTKVVTPEYRPRETSGIAASNMIEAPTSTFTGRSNSTSLPLAAHHCWNISSNRDAIIHFMIMRTNY